MKSPSSKRSATHNGHPTSHNTNNHNTIINRWCARELPHQEEEEGEMHAGKGSEMHQIIILI